MQPEAFIEALEACTLPPTAFGHRGHVFAAWACFTLQPPDRAARRYCRAVKGYATHLGAPEKYHETLTRALLSVILDRMQRQTSDRWEDFEASHRDLIEQAPTVLARHYSPARLRSARARTTFVAPDRAPLPAPLKGAA